MAASKRAPASARSAQQKSLHSTRSPPVHTQAVSDDDIATHERRLWAPTLETAVSLLLLPRVASALVNPIADCDETFNYWEPLHYLLHGFGFQTWEYSPAYALRSYVYLALHWFVAKATAFALAVGASDPHVSKVLVFYGVRGALGLLCAYAEGSFYHACIARFGRRTARYVLWLLVWNAGLFHASTALLPSSFTMYLVMLVTSAWMAQRHFVAVAFGIVAVLCGWPYVAVLFVPLAIDTLVTRGVATSVAVGISVGVAVLALEVSVNAHFYGRVVLPAWEIVRYNVLSSETDSTLYGIEPISFYVRNLALNMNVVAALAVPAPLVVPLLPRTPHTSTVLRIAFLTPLYTWLAIMFTQAHKEERFLSPVYPLLCLAAAVTLSALVHSAQRLHGAIRTIVAFAVAATLVSYALLSASRITSNVINYRAPLRVFEHLHDQLLPQAHALQASTTAAASTATVTLCVSKEWHRFPSSFFLPTNATRVAFVRSAFTGQLPQPFSVDANATRVVPQHMNNRNADEPSRYVHESACDWFVDLNLPHQAERKLWEVTSEWEIVFRAPFLVVEQSPSPFRSFYIPVLTPARVQFADYAVYKRIHA